jgi:coenzyme PQQ precursor peptide PqqA
MLRCEIGNSYSFHRWRTFLRRVHFRVRQSQCLYRDACLGYLSWEMEMAWKKPQIVEVPVGMEINMYACAARK